MVRRVKGAGHCRYFGMHHSTTKLTTAHIDGDTPQNPNPNIHRRPVRMPPRIWHYDQLAKTIHDLRDTILVALDFEMIDHPRHQKRLSESQKMSELGIAVYDPRDSVASPPYTIEERLQKIHVRHYVASCWRKTTPLTCDASMHTTWPGKRGRIVDHVAHPYDGVFARSRIRTQLQIRDKLEDVLNRLPTRCLTTEDVAEGKRRPVIILFWDARLEIKIMSQWKIQLPDYPPYPEPEAELDLSHDPFASKTNKKPRMDLWDHQKWPNLQIAKKNAGSTLSAYNMFSPLGVLECGHNAGNDVFAILGAFLYLLHSGEAEWNGYMTDFSCFPDEYMVKLDWVDPEVAEYNERLDASWDRGGCWGAFS